MNLSEKLSLEGETRENIQGEIGAKLAELREYRDLFASKGWQRLLEVRRQQIETAFTEWSNLALLAGVGNEQALGQAAIVRVARQFMETEQLIVPSLEAELKALEQRVLDQEHFERRRKHGR